MEKPFTSFIRNLLTEGHVVVNSQLQHPDEADEQEAVNLLRRYYQEAALELPLNAPAFDPEAALWSARYLFIASHLVMLRNVEEDAVKAHLLGYTGKMDAAAVFSVDLTLRYLPDLLQLAKGLAPDDVLVQCLQHTLLAWPFSSVGTGLEGDVEIGVILKHPSLKYHYRDRIIRHRDRNRMRHPTIRALIEEALGDYASLLWPEFQVLI